MADQWMTIITHGSLSATLTDLAAYVHNPDPDVAASLEHVSVVEPPVDPGNSLFRNAAFVESGDASFFDSAMVGAVKRMKTIIMIHHISTSNTVPILPVAEVTEKAFLMPTEMALLPFGNVDPQTGRLENEDLAELMAPWTEEQAQFLYDNGIKSAITKVDVSADTDDVSSDTDGECSDAEDVSSDAEDVTADTEEDDYEDVKHEDAIDYSCMSDSEAITDEEQEEVAEEEEIAEDQNEVDEESIDLEEEN